MIKICMKITDKTTSEEMLSLLNILVELESEIEDEEKDCKIFKLRDIHQIKGSLCMLLGRFGEALSEFEETLKLFRI